MTKRVKQSKNKKNNSKSKLKTFNEPKLTKQESLIKSTLISAAAAPGTTAVNS